MDSSRVGLSTAALCLWGIDHLEKLRICKSLKFSRIEIGLGTFKMLKEFVNLFDPLGYQKANPIFNRDKLDWFNGEYIRKISNSNLCKKFEIQNSDFKKMDKDKKIQITKLVKERIKKISDFDSLANFFFEEPKVDNKLFGIDYKKHIESALLVLKNINFAIDKKYGRYLAYFLTGAIVLGLIFWAPQKIKNTINRTTINRNKCV